MLRKKAKYYCWKYMKCSVPYTVGSLSMVLSSVTYGLTRGEISRFLTILRKLGYVKSKKVLSKKGCITVWKKVKDVSFSEILEKLRDRSNVE
jgi:DNA-binding IscR family transcriptional regulator